MKPVPKPAALRRHLAPRQKLWLNWDGVFLMGPNYLRFPVGLNVYPSGRNLRVAFDYLSRQTGESGARKGRLLAQVQVKF